MQLRTGPASTRPASPLLLLERAFRRISSTVQASLRHYRRLSARGLGRRGGSGTPFSIEFRPQTRFLHQIVLRGALELTRLLDAHAPPIPEFGQTLLLCDVLH